MSKPIAHWPLVLWLLCGALHAQTQPLPATATTRGQVLYETHCFACHTAQVHWRDKVLATDWDSLKALVRRWQATTGQSWSEADIVEVARYLNDAYYHHAQSSDLVTWLAPAAR
jgi:mono/diheme cytochrome c family protein